VNSEAIVPHKKWPSQEIVSEKSLAGIIALGRYNQHTERI